MGQLIVLHILSLKISSLRNNISSDFYSLSIENLKKIPEKLKKCLETETNIQLMAKEFLKAKGSMLSLIHI